MIGIISRHEDTEGLREIEKLINIHVLKNEREVCNKKWVTNADSYT